ncbi:MAG: ComEA family DNA-binding protein [Dehalococcoidales bacterium]|nr:ComEA family DNA-binding protein [Dehalococcoidales bacterium]
MENRRWTPLVISLLAIVITAGILVWSRYKGNQATEIIISSPPRVEQIGEVYIGGAVNNPGLYPLRADDSIAILVQVAGGTTGGTECDNISLYVLEAGEKCSPQKIDLNRAEVWLLEALPGIGSDRANAIVDYRNQNGPFRNVSELTKVSGIGTKTFQQIEPLVTIAE